MNQRVSNATKKVPLNLVKQKSGSSSLGEQTIYSGMSGDQIPDMPEISNAHIMLKSGSLIYLQIEQSTTKPICLSSFILFHFHETASW